MHCIDSMITAAVFEIPKFNAISTYMYASQHFCKVSLSLQNLDIVLFLISSQGNMIVPRNIKIIKNLYRDYK